MNLLGVQRLPPNSDDKSGIGGTSRGCLGLGAVLAAALALAAALTVGSVLTLAGAGGGAAADARTIGTGTGGVGALRKAVASGLASDSAAPNFTPPMASATSAKANTAGHRFVAAREPASMSPSACSGPTGRVD